MPPLPRVAAWRGPSLALQIMGLLLGGLVVAQLVTLALTLLLPPAPPAKYDLPDIAAAMRGEAGGLDRRVTDRPPPTAGRGWLMAEESRTELAGLLGVAPQAVTLAFYTPLPFAGTVAPPPGRALPPPVRPIRAEAEMEAHWQPAVLLMPADADATPADWLRLAQAGPGMGPGGGGGGSMGMGMPGRGGFPPMSGGMGGRFPSRDGAPDSRANRGGGERTGDRPGGGDRSGVGDTPFGSPGDGNRAPGGTPPFTRPRAIVGPNGPTLSGPIAPRVPVVSPDWTLPLSAPDAGSTAPRIEAETLPEAAPPEPTRTPERAPVTPTPPVREEPRNAPPVPEPAPAPATPVPAPPPSIQRAPVIAADPAPTGLQGALNRARHLFGLAPTPAPLVEGDFIASWRQPDGRWVVVSPHHNGWLSPWQKRVALWFALAWGITAPIGWLFARRLSRPLDRFAEAAARLGRDPSVALATLNGPAEIGRAANAFNLMQQRLRSFVDDRTAMVGAISHDLRTPLTRMRFRVEEVPDDVRAGLLSEVEEMEAMISSVLAFMRDASTPGVRERLDLRTLVDDVVEDAAVVGATVSVEAPAAAPVEVDVLGMRRVLANLLENALKYGAHPRIRLTVAQGEAIAAVIDDGPGLPDEELEQVFQPFYRTEAARSSGAPGTGLGLAVCRSIARAHGGDIRLCRSPEGFRAEVRMPLAYDALRLAA